MGELSIFSSEAAPPVRIEDARDKLSAINSNMVCPVLWQHGGEQLGNSFYRSDLMHSLANGVHFKGCDFIDAAGNGITWRNNIFSNCLFERSNFEFADLSHCVIESVDKTYSKRARSQIIGSGFSGAILREASISCTEIKGSSFAQCDFSHAMLKDCEFRSVTLEDARFYKAKLSGVNLAGTNPEYADLSNSELDGVTISIEHFPFIFGITLGAINSGGLSIVTNTTKNSVLSVDEIVEMIDDIAAVYNDSLAFFAGASLYYLFDKNRRFGYQVKQGMKMAILNEDYRSLKHLCKLCSIAARDKSLFTPSDLRKFYRGIITLVQRSNNPSARNHYRLHDGLIKSYLLADFDQDLVYISFNLLSPNSNLAGQLLADIVSTVLKTCNAVGINFKIFKTDIQVNSDPQINLTIGNIQVNVSQLTKDSGQRKDESSFSSDASGAKGWNSYTKYAAVVATLSLLLSGVNLFMNTHNDHHVPHISVENRNFVLQQRKKISRYIVDNTFQVGVSDNIFLDETTNLLQEPAKLISVQE